MKLTDQILKNTKPKSKDYKLSDGKGLMLLIHTNGSKYWRLYYRFNYKQKNLALGVYPYISIAQARAKAFEAKSMIANGIDPGEVRKKEKMLARKAASETKTGTNASKIKSGIEMKNLTDEISIFNNDSLIHIGKLADLVRSMNEISIQRGTVLYKVGILVLKDYCKFNNKTEFCKKDFIRLLTLEGLIESYNSEWFKTNEFRDEVKYYLASIEVDCTTPDEPVSDASLEQHNNALEFVKLSLALGPYFP